MVKANTKAAQSQIDRFKEAARQLEVDETEAAFDEKLKVVAKPSPFVREQNSGKAGKRSNNASKAGDTKSE